jgi:hypothetical protein
LYKASIKHHSFACVIHFYQHYLLKRLSFPHCAFLISLLKWGCHYMYGFIIRISILFHWFICSSLCQYCTVLGLDLCNIFWNWELWCLQLVFFFPLKINLAIWDTLVFHLNFRICVSIFLKKMWNWSFDSDCIELFTTLVSTDILTILILLIHEHVVSFYLLEFSLISLGSAL